MKTAVCAHGWFLQDTATRPSSTAGGRAACFSLEQYSSCTCNETVDLKKCAIDFVGLNLICNFVVVILLKAPEWNSVTG